MKAPTQKSHHDPNHGPEWQVTQCACGQLTLRLGPIRIEFTPDEFAQLDRMIADAAKRFDVVAADAPASTHKPLTH
jgi:hypothetical protein